MTRAYPIKPKALQAAAHVLSANAPGGMSPDVAKALARMVVSAYQKHRDDGRTGRPRSAATTALMNMKVGDRAIIPAEQMSTVHNRMVWVRKRTGERRKWTLRDLPDGRGELTRMPDDWTFRPPITSPLTKALVASQVGVPFTVPDIPIGRTTDAQYRRARELMREPHARWSYVTTTKGRRITRVA